MFSCKHYKRISILTQYIWTRKEENDFLIVGQGLRIKTLYNQNIVNFLTLEIITNILQILRFKIIAKNEGFARFIEEKKINIHYPQS